jgi:hypothetical protein
LFGQGRRGLREEIKRQIVGLKFFAKPFTIVGFLHCKRRNLPDKQDRDIIFF